MEGIPTDEASGRHLIEGKGIPIDGGVFRRVGQPGIVVDVQKVKDIDWFKKDSDLMLSNTRHGILGFATTLAKERMPTKASGAQDFADLNKENTRYSLNYFVEGEMGVPDVQALYTALLLEIRLANDKEGRKVWVEKDGIDGHAIAKYKGNSGLYAFDPTIGDGGFKKVE